MRPLPATRLHIGVIGAGTAGLAMAIAFARAGHTVDVFEKHSAPATLGAGVLIQPQGVAALDELGVGAAFNAISLPIDRLVGQCERGWTLVDIPYTGLQACAVSRAALGGVLERESHALGVRLHYGCAVGAIGVENGAGTVDAGGVLHRFDLVVIANGASSMLPAATGLAVASHQHTWGALWALIDLDD
jgi:2-polyprenyl-6-methoxyphenol hydroxylase-like FAD-dependent oxidoreductase